MRDVGWYRCRRGATIETVQNLGAVTPLAGTDGGPIAWQSGRSIRQGDDAFRGRDGPLRVTNPEPRDPLFATIIKAAAQVGV